jgi:uncharacterized protein YegP (UPF0339 family)
MVQRQSWKVQIQAKGSKRRNSSYGEAYESKQGCLDGIASVKKNAPIAKIEEAKE